MGTKFRILLVASALAYLPTASAVAADVFYSDYAAWQAAVSSAGLVEETLDFTAANVELADEVAGPLGASGGTPQENLGPTLTWDKANTGQSRSYNLAMEATNGDLYWNDTDGGGSNIYGPDVISLGNTNVDENDDAILRFTGPKGVFAVGFFLQGNENDSGEFFGVYDSITDSTDGSGAARSSTTLNPSGIDGFIGVVSDTAFFMAQFDESTNGDDIGIRGITIAAVPEPSGLAALAICGAGCVARRRRRQS